MAGRARLHSVAAHLHVPEQRLPEDLGDPRVAPARFGDLTPPPTPPFTIDEEGSGVIEITRIVKAAPWFTPDRRYYLGTAQAHAAWSITTGTRAPHT
ncbi:MAG: hypothetical protein M3495_02925 [Pseudomonadota bacterium]|nr:hypothetical protein [Pseudomonadota bacterium]